MVAAAAVAADDVVVALAVADVVAAVVVFVVEDCVAGEEEERLLGVEDCWWAVAICEGILGGLVSLTFGSASGDAMELSGMPSPLAGGGVLFE